MSSVADIKIGCHKNAYKMFISGIWKDEFLYAKCGGKSCMGLFYLKPKKEKCYSLSEYLNGYIGMSNNAAS